MKKIISTAIVFLAFPMLASGQNNGQRYLSQGYFFLAVAPSHASFAFPAYGGVAGKDTALQFGGGGEFLIGHGVGLGGELLRSTQTWLGTTIGTTVGSIDASYHFGPSTDSRKVEPFVTGGYTFFYRAADLGHENGVNFGGGVNIWLSRHAALRLEIRDDIGGRDLSEEVEDPQDSYYLRSSQHLVGFRVGVTFR